MLGRGCNHCASDEVARGARESLRKWKRRLVARELFRRGCAISRFDLLYIGGPLCPRRTPLDRALLGLTEDTTEAEHASARETVVCSRHQTPRCRRVHG